jgi:hypothetical protein
MGYGLIGAYVDVGDEVDEVARQENKNGVCTGIDCMYRGVVDCDTGHWEA